MAVNQIGTQKWSDTNLEVGTFQDGTPGAEVSSSEQWAEYAQNGTPGWCYYNFDSGNSTLYGRLYNWYAVTDNRQIAPTGFRVPTRADWQTLVAFAGSGPGKKLKNLTGWLSLTRVNPNGTNELNFKGNPGGYMKDNGEFWDQGWSANFWTQASSSADNAYSRRLYWSNSDAVEIAATQKGLGLSVRLICTGSCDTGDYNPTEDF